MRVRALPVIIAGLAVTAPAGCRSTERASPPAHPRTTARTPGPSAPAKRYTAAQLAKALITPPSGAAAVHRSSGPLADLIAEQSKGAPTGVSACGRPGDRFQRAPSAFVDFAQVERGSLVQLLAIPGEPDRRTALTPIPAACRSIKARAGGTTYTAKVVTDEPFDLADGGRIRGTDQRSHGISLHTWDVTFIGPGYVAICGVFGPHATRAEAERLARQEHRKAAATLR
jgi:hypothetical protein